MQGFLDLLAAAGILLQDLAEVFFFFPLQDAEEIVQFRHAEGIPIHLPGVILLQDKAQGLLTGPRQKPELQRLLITR